MTSVAEVLDLHQKFSKRLGPRDLGACWNMLGKLLRRSAADRLWLKSRPTAMASLLEQSKTLPATPRLACRLHLAVRSELTRHPRSLSRAARKYLPRFDAQAVANTAHGLATIGAATGWSADATIWTELAGRAAEVMDSSNSQSLTNTAYAFAKAGQHAPALLDAIAAAAAPRLSEFIPQGLANTAWAYATAEHAAPVLFDAIAEAAPPVECRRPPCPRTPPHLPPWTTGRLGPRLRTPGAPAEPLGSSPRPQHPLARPRQGIRTFRASAPPGGPAAPGRVQAAGARQHGVGVC